jgi:hypothetical protein
MAGNRNLGREAQESPRLFPAETLREQAGEDVKGSIVVVPQNQGLLSQY